MAAPRKSPEQTTKLWQRLLELAAAKGKTQADLARDLKLTDTALGKWRDGKSKPSVVAYKRLSALFDMSVDDLIAHLDVAEASAADARMIQSAEDFPASWLIGVHPGYVGAVLESLKREPAPAWLARGLFRTAHSHIENASKPRLIALVEEARRALAAQGSTAGPVLSKPDTRTSAKVAKVVPIKRRPKDR